MIKLKDLIKEEECHCGDSCCSTKEQVNEEVITEKKDPPHDAKKWENIKNKFQNHFSEKPGS